MFPSQWNNAVVDSWCVCWVDVSVDRFSWFKRLLQLSIYVAIAFFFCRIFELSNHIKLRKTISYANNTVVWLKFQQTWWQLFTLHHELFCRSQAAKSSGRHSVSILLKVFSPDFNTRINFLFVFLNLFLYFTKKALTMFTSESK